MMILPLINVSAFGKPVLDYGIWHMVLGQHNKLYMKPASSIFGVNPVGPSCRKWRPPELISVKAEAVNGVETIGRASWVETMSVTVRPLFFVAGNVKFFPERSVPSQFFTFESRTFFPHSL